MHDLIPLAAILGFFGTIAGIFLLPGYLRSKERQKMQDNLRLAIEKGQQLPVEIVEALSKDVRTTPSRSKDIRRAVIWFALAGALATIGAIAGWHEGYTDEAPSIIFGFAAVPFFIGLAFAVLAVLNKNRD